ncbi:MAG: hypothetical protein WED15_09590 [Akkermansiaceae bacterium]
MSAKRAFWRASWFNCSFEEERSETLERLSSPIAITVNKIISDRVTTKAKPRGFRPMLKVDGFFVTKWVFGDGFVAAGSRLYAAWV